jgi:FtsP/CotA-like multicopper oxidase with cupredoxin domain
MLSRRNFLKLTIAGGAASYVVTRGNFLKAGLAAQSPQIPLKANTIPQFVDELPNLLAADSLIGAGSSEIDLVMTERKANVLSTGTLPNYTGTWTWSYLAPGQANRASYLGPVIVAARNQPTTIKFTNDLGLSDTTNVLAYKYSTDQTLHWADPLHVGTPDWNMWNHMSDPPPVGSEGSNNYSGPIPACPHLHGGYVPPVLDGGPDSWFTSDGAYQGAGYYTHPLFPVNRNECIYRYPNDQEEALIWFHDHTLGATRLNVYCGLAGGFLLIDGADTVVLPSYMTALPNLAAIVPLVIQDRMFDTNGQLFFPSDSAGGVLWSLNPEHPYWVPEFIGDVICVNGKTWPRKTVEQRRYLFMMINGSNARSYEMNLYDLVSGNVGPALWVVGTDGGLLDFPVKIDPLVAGNNKLVMMPGERYWVIVDFKGYGAGVKGPHGKPYSGKWIIRNSGKAPYPGGTSPHGSTTSRIMQFVVTGGPVNDSSYDPATMGALRSPMVRLTGAPIAKTRQLTLNEIALPPRSAIDTVTGLMTKYPGGPEEILVNNTKWSGERIIGVTNGMYDMLPIDASWDRDPVGNYLSEVPDEGTTEIWEIVNTTMDAHPIHTHLAQFQLLSRQAYDSKKYFAAYSAAFPVGFDYTLKASVGPGVFIPAYGPPLPYNTAINGKVGGNPDVTPFLKGALQGPLPQENGWKDTVMAPPGMVTRFAVRWGPQGAAADAQPDQATLPFDPAVLGGGYVWHCHIVDHEDNEMMRPDMIKPNLNATRTYNQGSDY